MSLVAPTLLTPLPPPPTTIDPLNFDLRADAKVAADVVMVGEMNVQMGVMYGNALDAMANAATVASNVATTNANATAAAANANFKGNYSTLTGALNVPSSVAYNGTTWQLLQNLANVTTQVPSILTAAYWLPIVAFPNQYFFDLGII